MFYKHIYIYQHIPKAKFFKWACPMDLDILKVKTMMNRILYKDHSIKLSHSFPKSVFSILTSLMSWDLVNDLVTQKLPFPLEEVLCKLKPQDSGFTKCKDQAISLSLSLDSLLHKRGMDGQMNFRIIPKNQASLFFVCTQNKPCPHNNVSLHIQHGSK